MPVYRAPVDDIRFVLAEVAGYGRLASLPGYEEATPELIDQLVAELARFAENELAPLNLSGDKEGCSFENGVVRTPRGFKEAYRAFAQGGWTGICVDPAYGGQGLPHIMTFVLSEVLSAANMAFGMYPGLSAGACEALEQHAGEALKAMFLPPLAEGRWSGTMCLTEPHCGTDLGLIRTRAAPTGAGAYAITGTKIFISAGEHDLTDNIIHLVLARLPDAPAGTSGISLFLVPKFLPKPVDGDNPAALGARNGIFCASIEHKMGIRASSTCVLNFEEATGWLVGRANGGMRAMFTMMNAARLSVGLQGLGLADVASQNAVHYVRERLQGRSLTGSKAPNQPADPLIVQPDVRKTLLWIRSLAEGARALGYWLGVEIDISRRHPHPDTRLAAEDLVALMTPVVKAFFSDFGFEATVRAQQMFGGHGYIWDTGMEQFVRDARITQIYEGANAIQALDLVGRKLPLHTGRLLRRFFHPLQAEVAAAMTDPALAGHAAALAKACGRLQQATLWVAGQGVANPDEAGAAATDYLRLFALVALGWMWLRMSRAALVHRDRSPADARFCDNKLKTAAFFFGRILPETSALSVIIRSGSGPVMAMEAANF